jgi:hypothetical protein
MSKRILILLFITVLSTFTHCYEYPRFKQCDPEWADNQLWINFAEPDRHFTYTFCHDEERKGEAMFINGKLMVNLANALFVRGISCGDLGICNPGKVNQLLIKLNFNGDELQRQLGLGDSHKIDNDINVKEYLDQNVILLSTALVNEKWAFFLVTGQEGENVLGIDQSGNDVKVNPKDTWGYLAWPVLKKTSEEFLQ